MLHTSAVCFQKSKHTQTVGWIDKEAERPYNRHINNATGHKMQTVKYLVKYAEHTVTDAEYDLVYAMFNLANPQKVLAIKFIRTQYGIGLKEAKDICDAIGSAPRAVPGW